jgi:hypothetical protein
MCVSCNNIVNIINFIRGVEPRDPSIDLLEPVVQQMRLVKAHGLSATWLLQYDALIDQRFVTLLKEEQDGRQEIGAWFEVVQPLVEKAGLKWRGRFPWDWHSHVGFSIGYTPEERKKMADVYMADFKAVWGHYPKSVGSWFMDAVLLGYLSDCYGIVASCTCKDQSGTDGYTMWGGYINQAYYPSRKNSFMPAQTTEGQIPVPVFRMLGSDPIYQYDAGLEAWTHDSQVPQSVVSLEPVYQGGGGNPQWVRWFFDVNFNAPNLAFGYTQVGQENSFGWPAMVKGFTDQIGLLAEKVGKQELRVETLEASGHWFQEQFPVTPATAVCALYDWKDENRKSLWYDSRFYRANLFWEKGRFWIRDIHLFDETYPERYLTEVCTTENCLYDTLPIWNGYHWSGRDARARMYLIEISPDGTHREISVGSPKLSEKDETVDVRFQTDNANEVEIICQAGSLEFKVNIGDQPVKWGVKMEWSAKAQIPIQQIDPEVLHYQHNGHNYQLRCGDGHFERYNATSIILLPDQSNVSLLFMAR